VDRTSIGMLKYMAATAVAALVLHVVLGWAWSVLASVGGGYFSGRRGWLVGGAALLVSWSAITWFRFLQAPAEVSEMARVVAGLAGGVPAFTTYLLTMFIGTLLGVAGGFLGSSIAEVRRIIS